MEGAAAQEPLTKLQRTVEITRILYRNHFFDVLRRINEAEQGPGGARIIPKDAPGAVRRMLEELGPTFIKIGQLLATRPDIVPQPFIDEFQNLYDKTAASPYDEIKSLIESELGRPIGEVYEQFDEKPVASASVGQVHFATLKGGGRVAVKVQHPGIHERVRVDFQIMEPIIRFVENLVAASRVWQPREHLLEVEEMLKHELDYRNEAKNLERVAENFAGEQAIKIPAVYWQASSERVLTLELIDGIKLSDLDAPEVKALDGKKLARIITHGMARQIFEHRMFHADPSPGNLMAMDSNAVAFLDWGAVGTVSRRRSDRILTLILGFVREDLETVAQAIIGLSTHGGDVELMDFHRDVERILEYHWRHRASVADPVVLQMILDVARRHDLLLPPDFMLITRALFQFEGMCKKLDPDYELVDVLEPYVLRHIKREFFGGDMTTERMTALLFDVFDTVRTLPPRVNKVLSMAENGQLRMRVDPGRRSDRRLADERRNLRSSFTVLVGAVLVGIAVIMAQGAGNLIPYLFTTILFVLVWGFFYLYWSE